MYETSQMTIPTKQAGSDWTQHLDKTLHITSRKIQDRLEWQATLTILWKKRCRSGYIQTLLTQIWDSHKISMVPSHQNIPVRQGRWEIMVKAYEREHPSYPRLSSKGYMLTDCKTLLLSSHQPTLGQEAWALSVCI